jgi:hypothetical protein
MAIGERRNFVAILDERTSVRSRLNEGLYSRPVGEKQQFLDFWAIAFVDCLVLAVGPRSLALEVSDIARFRQ